MREIGKLLEVKEFVPGTSLTVALGASPAVLLTVEDPTDFDEEGGQLALTHFDTGVVSILTYDQVDDEANTIRLTTAPGAHPIDSGVEVYPKSITRYALIRDDDNDEADPVEARVPLSLYDRFALGTRDPEGEQWVEVERQGSEWVVTEMFAERPPQTSGPNASTGGARYERDDSGFRLYNDAGDLTVDLDAETGDATFTGTVVGSEIWVPSAAIGVAKMVIGLSGDSSAGIRWYRAGDDPELSSGDCWIQTDFTLPSLSLFAEAPSGDNAWISVAGAGESVATPEIIFGIEDGVLFATSSWKIITLSGIQGLSANGVFQLTDLIRARKFVQAGSKSFSTNSAANDTEVIDFTDEGLENFAAAPFVIACPAGGSSLLHVTVSGIGTTGFTANLRMIDGTNLPATVVIAFVCISVDN